MGAVFQQMPLAITSENEQDASDLTFLDKLMVIALVAVTYKKAKYDKLVEELVSAIMDDINATAKKNGTDDPCRYLSYATTRQKVPEEHGRNVLELLKETRRKVDPEGFKLGMNR